MLPFTIIIIIVCVTFIFRNAIDERAPPRSNGPGVRVRNKKGQLRHKLESIGTCENEKKNAKLRLSHVRIIVLPASYISMR